MAMTEAQIQALYQVTYPINFVANGDTVHDGFHKHIQEIERIYGLLGGLERSKVTTGDLVSTLANYVTKTEFNNHVNSTNPHPNLQLATLGGNLDVSRITGNWPLNRVSGTLGTGNMDISGLKSSLQSWVEGTLSPSGNSNNGYITLGGIVIQWGWIKNVNFRDGKDIESVRQESFNYSFPNSCNHLFLSSQFRLVDETIGVVNAAVDMVPVLISWTRNDFKYIIEEDNDNKIEGISSLNLHYLGIGY